MTSVFNHPWLGGLFGDDEAAAIWSPDRQLSHMLALETAYTRALGAAGRISAEVAEKTATRIAGIASDIAELRDGTAKDGTPVPALVAQLKRAIGDSDAIHKGTTSQDVLDTALALALAEFNALLVDRLDALALALADLSMRFGDRPLTGRTRMQEALPITVSDRLATWALPLAAHKARLDQLRPRVEVLQFGGAAGNRADLGRDGSAIAAEMAARLKLGNPPRAWHAMRDNLAEYAGLLSLISGTLGKMGQDICLMAQQGIDEITLDGGGGSSAMAHKQNPVLAELLVTLARFNATQVAAMHQALVHEQERSGAAWALEWMILPQMAQATARSLSAASQICTMITGISTPSD